MGHMDFELRVSPSGQPIEGTDLGDILTWVPSLGKWRTGSISALLLGQLRFLVGPTGSGANYTDLDTALAAAAQVFADTGERQTVFLVAGSSYGSASNPLQIPDGVDLEGLGATPPEITSALLVNVPATQTQTVKNVTFTGDFEFNLGFPLEGAIVVAGLPATSTFRAENVNAIPANDANAWILGITEGGTLELDGCAGLARGANNVGLLAVSDFATTPTGTFNLTKCEFDGPGQGISIFTIVVGHGGAWTLTDCTCRGDLAGLSGQGSLRGPWVVNGGRFEGRNGGASDSFQASLGPGGSLVVTGSVCRAANGPDVDGSAGDFCMLDGLDSHPLDGQLPGACMTLDTVTVVGGSYEHDDLWGIFGARDSTFIGVRIRANDSFGRAFFDDPMTFVGCDIATGGEFWEVSSGPIEFKNSAVSIDVGGGENRCLDIGNGGDISFEQCEVEFLGALGSPVLYSTVGTLSFAGGVLSIPVLDALPICIADVNLARNSVLNLTGVTLDIDPAASLIGTFVGAPPGVLVLTVNSGGNVKRRGNAAWTTALNSNGAAPDVVANALDVF